MATARKISLAEMQNVEEAKEFRAIFGDREVELQEFKEKLAAEIERLQKYVKRQELLKGLLIKVMDEKEKIGNITKLVRTVKKPTDELVSWLKEHHLYSRVVEEKISMSKLNPLIERHPEIMKLLDITKTAYLKINGSHS
ncbi:MAG: hypothetical protein DRJ64_05100 [Thermoprotei archaeon]|nr:MAG: hypothetical protein DRJ64_05100 [Thermoprotei archaeon]